MRALAGAIITAGALIGLGLTALGFGIRFQPMLAAEHDGHVYGIPSMATILIVLLLAVIIGLGISFLGLAFHHARRHHEMQRDLGRSRPETLSGA
jgi:uncharacterized membrane protein YidH (DUF202 family)